MLDDDRIENCIYKRNDYAERYMHLLNELNEIPEKVAWILEKSEKIKNIAEKYKDAQDFLYLGRGYNFPIALEGALN